MLVVNLCVMYMHGYNFVDPFVKADTLAVLDGYSVTMTSLRSWRYCVGARLKFWRRSRVPKKGSGDEAVEIPPARKPRYFE